MKNLSTLCLALLLLTMCFSLIACDPNEDVAEFYATATMQIERPVSTSVADPTPFLMVTKEPSVAPNLDRAPTFSNLYFSLSADGEPRKSFGYDEGSVYAILNLSDLPDGTLVSAKFAGDEQYIFEMTWEAHAQDQLANFSQLVLDVEKISEELPSGLYIVELYLNEELALTEFFEVNKFVFADHNSSGKFAYVQNNNQLVVSEPNRGEKVVATGLEIQRISWFKSGSGLIFIDLDRSERFGVIAQNRDDSMWRVDLNSGKVEKLGEHFWNLQVNDNESKFTVYEGNDWHDGCELNRRIRFGKFQPNGLTEVWEPTDFVGFPFANEGSFYPADGAWSTNSKYVVELVALCSYVKGGNALAIANAGVYEFDVELLTVEKIGELEVEN